MSVNNFDQIANLKVKITTLLDQSITGFIYAFSSTHELLALRISNNSKNLKSDTFRFINTAFIKSIQVLPPFPKKGSASQKTNINGLLKLSHIPIKEFEENLERSIAEYKVSLEIHNPKASAIANKLFKKFYKLYGSENVQWSGSDNIILFNEIKLSKPYTLGKSGNVQELVENSTQLPDVQKTLKDIWLEVDNEKRGG